MEIHVVQGERPSQRTISRSESSSLPGSLRLPRYPQIEVTFDIDANGIIHVSAKDLGTGNEQAITIKGDKKLSEDDIKRMVNDAKSFEDDDKKKREEIEVRNMADTAIFAAEKMLKDSGDKIEPGDREKIESGVAEVRKALESDNSEEIKKQMEALTEAYIL